MGNGGRSAFLAPSSNFADFGHNDFFGLRRVEGKGAPEDVVIVQVSIMATRAGTARYWQYQSSTGSFCFDF